MEKIGLGVLKKFCFFYFVCACVQYPGKPEEGGRAPRVGVTGGGVVVVVVFFGILAEYQRWVPSLLAVSLR